MTTNHSCPNCGKTTAADALMGMCPDCLLKAGVATGSEAGGSGAASKFVPPTPAELARFFPQLEIFELIGHGGMGAVYKARQRQLDRYVALKILPPDVGRDPAFAGRFAHEARALAKLNHPNIVTLYEFGQADGLFFFLMEFVDGMNLRQLLHVGRIAPREALAIVPQICDALQYAHDAGIVHRDIKPENILLDRRGHVKVADFGLAKIVAAVCDRRDTADEDLRQTQATATENLTAASKVMGTPQYMAPEQTEHPADVDHRADIYSLGVVFYQMLTGELPQGDFAPPSKKVVVDVRLDEVVLRALEKQPERRYQQVSEVKTLVETIAATAPAGASHTPGNLPKTSLCYISTPEHLRSFRGHYINIYRGKGELRLDHEAISFRSGWPTFTVPLSSIHKLAQGDYPYSAKPVPLHYIAVTFEERGEERTLLFTPVIREVMLPDAANKLATEWLVAIQDTFQACTGRTLAVERSGIAQDRFWVIKTLLAIAVSCTVSQWIIPLIVFQRLPNRLGEWLPWPALTIAPAITAMFLVVFWLQRRFARHPGRLDTPATLSPIKAGTADFQPSLARPAALGSQPSGKAAPGQSWQSPTSGWGWLIGKMFGFTFTSPLAYKCANLSALGFLGSLGFLRDLPVPGAQHCAGFFGLYGLFGLIGLAQLVEIMARILRGNSSMRRIVVVGRRGGKAAINWPGVLLSSAIAFAVALAVGESFVAITSLIVINRIAALPLIATFCSTLAAVTTILTVVIRKKLASPVEKLKPLDEPAAAAQMPQVPSLGITDTADSQTTPPLGAPAGRWLPWVVFSLIYLGFLGYVTWTAHLLPALIASHFDLAGHANGWMRRPVYLAFIGALPAALAALFVIVGRLTRIMPAYFVNIPRRDYWLAPQRRAATAAFLVRQLIWLACPLTCFYGGLHYLTIEANRIQPPNLAAGPLLGLVIGLMLALIIWISQLLMRMAETKTDAQSPPLNGADLPPVGPATHRPKDQATAHATRYGRWALGLCLGGLVLPALFVSLFLALHLPPQTWFGVPLWIGVFGITSICELAAFILGIIGWKSGAGKAAVIVAAVLPLSILPASSLLGLIAGFKQAYQAKVKENLSFGPVIEQVRTPSSVAPTETWSPALAPGEKPDLQKIREEADRLMNQGRYEEALQRHIWYFNHALAYREVNPVCLSFGLAGWSELARRYPKARQALIEVRDRDTQTFAKGGGYGDLFAEVANINRELGDGNATVALFKSIRQQDPVLARHCYFYAEALLASQGEYALCSSYIRDPQARFQNIRTGWVMEKKLDPAGQADNRLVANTCQLIEILVGAGRKTEADTIRDKAMALLDDARLKSAVSAAEETVRHKLTKSKPTKPFSAQNQTATKATVYSYAMVRIVRRQRGAAQI